MKVTKERELKERESNTEREKERKKERLTHTERERERERERLTESERERERGGLVIVGVRARRFHHAVGKTGH